MREWLTLSEVHAAMSGQAWIELGPLAEKLGARGGNVRRALDRLIEQNAALRCVLQSAYHYAAIPDAPFTDERLRAWESETSSKAAGAGNLNVEEGGLPARKRDAGPLKLYGEDPNRPRPKLDVLCTVEAVKTALARALFFASIERARKAAPDCAMPLEIMLACEADAHADAAEMIRARITSMGRRKAG